MPPWAPWRALSVVLMVAWARPPAVRGCPRPCACYVPSEVHCTFRSLASVPAGLSPQVERINLGFNSIQALSETSFAGLTKLELLMLHGNHILTIPDGALRDLTSLQVFKFSYNKLRVITAETLRGLRGLVRLHVDHNQIEFIHPQAFQGLTSLRLLHLEGNRLRQLHPATFSTFSFLDYFRLSSIRHLYLAENELRSLPDGALQNMPLLENVYLQGNPWACDCSMRWFLEWGARSKGVLKCKKDKGYEGGQLCATCFSPKSLQQREIQKLRGVACVKPSIESPLRHNASSSEEEQDQDDDAEGPPPLEGLPFPPWNISLNMTDEHGNTVSLLCDIQKPTDVGEVHLNQTDAQEIEINATVALDVQCPMTREKYEKLWKLIAYYSEVPVKLHREGAAPEGPGDAFLYRQDADDDALYYTGVRAHILAQPAWVTQPSLELQLNRRQSTAKKVLLSYRAHFSVTTSGKDAGPARSRSWVMIEPAGAGQGVQTVLEGASCQLSCNVKASERPSIFWVLPDGSVLKGPTEDPGGRFSILTSGQLRIQPAAQSDSGVYHCVAQVTDDADRVVYRLLVEPPATQPSGRPTVTIHRNSGDSLMLPCRALAVPEAQVSWILPGKRMIHDSANASQVYMLPNGTLSIPKAQVSDSGYYRCVALNPQGADRLTVGVTVTKKSSGKSSKRGRRPGGKGPPRLRTDVVEDERGSGTGDEEDPPRRLLHPKDQETFLRPKEDRKTKKGRRKPKPWKDAEKEADGGIAEGRRVFESRRRVNVANKQINPERWADILARVRGKNLPKGAEGREAAPSTTPPSVSLEATAILPVVSPPSMSLVQTAASVEEFSGGASFLGEEDRASTTASPSSARLAGGQTGVPLAGAEATSPGQEEFIGDALSENTEGPVLTTVASPWATATTWIPSVPHKSSPRPRSRDATSSAPPEPQPPVYADVDIPSQPDEDQLEEQDPRHDTPTPTGPAVESWTTSPVADSTSRAPGVPTQGHQQEETENTQLAKNSVTPRDQPLVNEGTQKTPLTLQGSGTLEGDPTRSRGPDGRNEDTAFTTSLDAMPPHQSSGAPFESRREATLAPLGDKDTAPTATTVPTQKATAPPAPTTQAPRKRPNGRRRLRPHKLQHRHQQSPPTTPVPTETVPTRPTQEADAKTPRQAEAALPVPTSWAEPTVGTPRQAEVGTQAEHVTRAGPRRKHGKKPPRHRYNTPTATSTVSAPTPAPSVENRRTSVMTAWPEPSRASPATSLGPGDPREIGGGTYHVTATPATPASPHAFGETAPATREPASNGKAVERDGVTGIPNDRTDSFVPGESGANVVSPSVAEVFTVGHSQEEPPPSVSPGPGRWNPPGATQPGTPDTDTPTTTSSENVTDLPPVLQEPEDGDLPSEGPPSAAFSTSFPPEEAVPSTAPKGTRAEPSSRQTATTTHSQDFYKATAVLPRSEIRPDDQGRPPARVEEPAPPWPPTALTSVARTTTEPANPTATASPVAVDAKENVFFNSVRIPETKAPPVDREGTEPVWRTNELSSPSAAEGALKFTPKQGSGKEAFDDRTKNSLPRGPESYRRDGRVHGLPQPTRAPARGTMRPPHGTTPSPFRYLVTLQAPRHFTNKPGITAYPSRVLPESKHPATPRVSSAASPVDRWHSSQPNKLPERGADSFTGLSKVLGSNNVPDLGDPVGRLPSARGPPYAHGRFPLLLNRTFSFPQLAGTPKPPTATSALPATAERKANLSPYNKIHAHGVLHTDFGPPAPPLLPRPRTVSPPSTNVQSVPLVHPTRSSIPFVTSPGPPSRSFPQSSSKLFSAGGPPASKFWTLGEKPQIITKSPQTVSVFAETDVVLPCEATGKPKPFITWTKVATGALMTPNTRVQRFEVLKNGTFVIRKVQVQDRGQYMCTAKNLHGADRMVVLLSVSVQQPQILASHYQDVTVYLGDTIAMECLAKGTPAPQISWIFPDRRVWQTVSPVEGRITLHENRTLSIKEASFADRGVYKCVASNAAGADSLAIRLHVAALPPVIHQEKLENISLPPGLSIHIHCTAKAAPLPSLRWVLWDGTQIRPSQFIHGNLFVFPNGTLYIRNLAPKDSGRYECVAANLVGTARRTVQLTVRRAAANARITGTSPQRTNVHYGGTLRLDCSASGDPWPRILWRLPSKRMIDALFSFDSRVKAFDNGTLVVKSVTDKDAGDYLCVARNKVGDDFVVLKVNVVMQPAKIEHKEDNDHRVFYGGDLKVDCVASGLPNPEISWSLPDGSLVSSFMQSDDSGGRAKRYVVFNNGTLYFNEVGMREEGDYTCFAENQVGKDEMTVRVKVVPEPAAIRNKTYSVVHVPYGDVVTVACDVKGEPTPRVTWLSPTNRLIPSSSEKYQIYQDGTLLIQKAQRSDSGNYTCVVRNSAGEDRKVVWIHVNVQSPKINGNPDAITTVREIAAGGSRKLIDCHAEGVPTPKVLWAFPEGVVLPAPYYGNRVTIHRNGTLDIKSLRKSDSVQLTCIGRNEGGEARLIVQLTVLEPMEKPVFHDPVNEKITAMAGHTISLNCSATGTPTPTLVWVLPNGTEVRSGQQLLRFYHKRDGLLHISSLSSADAGAYRCVARNAAGHTERLVSLKVGLKPEVTKQYHNLVSIINGETLNLHCLAPGGRPAHFSWTLPSGLALQGPQTRGRISLWDNGTLTVREASVFDRGTYACRADSEYGPSLMTFPVIVIAYPPRITSEPTPVIYARPGSTVKMNCMAMGIPKAEVTWELPDKSRLTAGTQARVHGHRSLHPQGVLTIQQTTQRDAGFYKCTAQNILGSDSKTTYIHVY